MRVHVYTSPHLVRFAERIRLAGKLVTDEALADTLTEVERVNAGAEITEFEVLMAVSFVLVLPRSRRISCVLEVGLGGRGDATNVIDTAAASAIASISMDHREFLGDTLAQIAGEKAGIMKPGVPVVTGAQSRRGAGGASTPTPARSARTLLARGRDWTIEPAAGGLLYADARGKDRAAAAVAARHAPVRQRRHRRRGGARVRVAGRRMRRSPAAWPPPNGRHACSACAGNSRRCCRRIGSCGSTAATTPAPGIVLAEQLSRWPTGPLHLDRRHEAGEGLCPNFSARSSATRRRCGRSPNRASIWRCRSRRSSPPPAASPAPARRQRKHSPPFRDPARPRRVLICGSLYLAGEVLKLDGWSP